MIKKIIFCLLFASISTLTIAQDKPATPDSLKLWKKGGSTSLTFTRVNLKNWSGGGQSSVSFGTILKLFANYKKDRWSWDNGLDLGYGIARVGASDGRFKKSDDQIILSSKVNYNVFGNWNVNGLIDFRSQLANGYSYSPDTTEESGERATLISRFMAPGYLLTSVGFGYKKENFYFTVSPLTGKFTFVLHEGLSNAGAYGVDPGESVRVELGSLLKAGFKTDVAKNVNFSTGIILFSGYESFGDIDVNWESLLTLKVNKYLSTTFSTLLIYDDDINVPIDNDEDGTPDEFGPRIQFKDVLNVGLLYQF